MVTRKPVPDSTTTDPTPHPQPPVQDPDDFDSEPSAAEQWRSSRELEESFPEQQHDGTTYSVQYSNAGPEEENVWDREDIVLDPTTDTKDANKIPESLVPGAGVSRTETNPFKRKPSPTSGQVGATVPHLPAEASPMPPSESFSKLTVQDTGNNPWQPALDEQKKPYTPAPFPSTFDQEPAKDVWASQEHLPIQPASTGASSLSPAIESLPSDASGGWEEDPLQKAPSALPSAPLITLEDEALNEDSHAWDDLGTQDLKGKAPMTAATTTERVSPDDWNLVDNEPDTAGPSGHNNPQDVPPSLPPRNQGPLGSGKTETYQIKNIRWHDVNAIENPRTSPILVQNANGPCPLVALVNALTLTTPASPQGLQDTVLVHTLKTREQISLDLLLDAVLDELMSERRTSPDQALPDITELYAFLRGLHTGMNVNPRFTPTEENEKAFKRTSLTHLHPTERGNLIPGTFEDTQEMAFYRIFSIPLIHGWIPPKSDPVYDALARQAESYEDAQNLLFREEELEEKLSSPTQQGLTEEEQSLYHDVLIIKSFLHSSATQLTPWGLEVITKAMKPGSFAILFRNDHFSTLYRHPQTQQLLALVTDAGYSAHDEIIWESLADVNGESSDFYSGDFRVVSGNSQQQDSGASGSASAAHNWPSNEDSGGQGEWSTVQNKRGKHRSQVDERPPMSPKELEDRDLALALQLQEEEDERHRAEQAQRRRESLLSEQYIEQQGVRQGPAGLRQGPDRVATTVTGRRQSSATPSAPPTAAQTRRPTQQTVRSLIPQTVPRHQGVSRPTDDEDDDAPPSYEQASKAPSYVPPTGHPSHPTSSPSTSMNSSPVPGTSTPLRAPVAQRQQSSNPSGFRRGSFRQGVPPAAAGGGPGSGSSGRDKDCVIM